MRGKDTWVLRFAKRIDINNMKIHWYMQPCAKRHYTIMKIGALFCPAASFAFAMSPFQSLIRLVCVSAWVLHGEELHRWLVVLSWELYRALLGFVRLLGGSHLGSGQMVEMWRLCARGGWNCRIRRMCLFCWSGKWSGRRGSFSRVWFGRRVEWLVLRLCGVHVRE